MKLTKEQLTEIRSEKCFADWFSIGNLLDTIDAHVQTIAELTERLRVSKMNSRVHEERAASLDRDGYTLRATIAELTAKLDAVREVAKSWRSPLRSMEATNRNKCADELLDILDAPAQPAQMTTERDALSARLTEDIKTYDEALTRKTAELAASRDKVVALTLELSKLQVKPIDAEVNAENRTRGVKL